MNSRLVIAACVALNIFTLSPAFAVMTECQVAAQPHFVKMLCKDQHLQDLQSQVDEKYLNAQLMSNAPLSLLKTSQEAWQRYIQQCKTAKCISKQLEQRIDDLSFITTMNQSLTQHYIRYKAARIDPKLTQLQFHQLDKNRIKIEGIQYRNPNNSESTAVAYLRAYTSPDQLNNITDLESKCNYHIERTTQSLNIQSTDQKCQRFVGLYKLYD